MIRNNGSLLEIRDDLVRNRLTPTMLHRTIPQRRLETPNHERRPPGLMTGPLGQCRRESVR